MTLFLAVAAAALMTPTPAGHHDHGPQLGKVSFETSCNAAADAHVRRGLGWLHSFEYEQAARTFNDASAADPRCGIAYWGVAMSQYHPLWAPPAAA